MWAASFSNTNVERQHMRTTIWERLVCDDDQGFSLIDVMIVVLIIAILLSIAIPSFLQARNPANARATQSDLHSALMAEQTQWTDAQAFSGSVATMSSIEPNLHWTVTSPVNTNTSNSVLVTVDTPAIGTPGTEWVQLTAMGKDNHCWSIARVNDSFGAVSAGTYYNRSTPTANGCAAPGAPTGAPTGGSAARGSTTDWYSTF
jgi:type IV pilus assembly protein PilA